jgi:hypothetical protein
MSYVNTVVEMIESQAAEATTAINTLEREGPRVIRLLVNSYLDTIPLFPKAMENEISGELIARLIAASNYAKEMLVEEVKLAHMLGNPDRLRAAAGVIDSAVVTAATNLSTDVRPDSLIAMSDPTQWDGPASYIYPKSFVGQSQAVALAGTEAAVLSEALGSLANVIEQFYGQLLLAVVGLVLAIASFVVAILTAITAVGIPVAIVAAVIAGLSADAAMGTLAMAFLTEMQSVSDSIGSLHKNPKAWPSAHFAS